MKKPLVSVIVPIYNCEKNLEKCIDSIINQTYKNLEILLIDDGSKDSSLDICRKYAEKDERIKVISQSNSGVSAARNTGITNAHGDYIGFIDSDDYIDLKMYEIMVKTICERKTDIVACNYYCIENTKIKSKNFEEKKLCNKSECLNAILSEPIGWRNWNKLYSAKIIIKKNIRFNNDIRNGEDGLFTIEFIDKSEQCSMYFIDDFLYYYIHDTNPKKYSYKMKDLLVAFEKYIKILTKYCLNCNNLKIDYIFIAYKCIKSGQCVKTNEIEQNITSYMKSLNKKELSLKQKIKLLLLNVKYNYIRSI